MGYLVRDADLKEMFAELCGKEAGCGADKDASMHLLLFYTGEQRNAHEVLEEQLERTRRGRPTGS
jgi:TPP-dependent pyruvate/acetoin dehydrogenase alpha subunit